MRVFFFFQATAIVLALAPPVVGRLVPIPNEGASMVIPDDWKIEQHQGFVLVATTSDDKASVTVRVIPNRQGAKAGESFYLEAVKQEREKLAKRNSSSLIIIEAGTAAVNGVPASYIHTEMPLPDDRTIYSRDLLLAANGKFFGLSGDAPDPYQDARVNDILGTFRFDAPPVLPDIERSYYHRLKQVVAALAIILIITAAIYWWIIRRRPLKTTG